jgi:hypothetical protein
MEREKSSDLLKRIHEEYEVIPGIHNYCDRWCQRCRFFTRCSVYLMEVEEEKFRAENNLPEQDFEESMINILQDTMEMIIEMAAEDGIELSEEMDAELEFFPPRRTGKKHYLFRKADEHSKWLIKWLRENRKKLDTKVKEFSETSKQDFLIFENAIDSLSWYMHFIAVKFARALVPPYDESPESSYDKNGSAKIAIIATENTMQAISAIMSYFPEDEDEFLTALVRLERIRKRALKEFPDAMSFKRPGFDD